MTPIKIAFHGSNVANFRPGFEALIGDEYCIVDLSEDLAEPGEREHYETADVIIGIRLDTSLPTPRGLRLFHAPAAGTDAIDRSLLPAGIPLCNCFGHEQAIAEYVMAALLQRQVPFAGADAELRHGRWTYGAGRPSALHDELGSKTIGLLGFGHIGKTVAERARAFGMRVNVANRSKVEDPLVDLAFGLDQLSAFMASADVIVVSLPLTPQTSGIVGAAELAAMRHDAVILNVGRGPLIDEQALYRALSEESIGGAVIDTWYQYPTAYRQECAPATYDFAALPNVLMTPHMSGWTHGMVQRRQRTIAENIRRLLQGQDLVNVLTPR
jgi:phosphoglycerate dehydrogenase-like enzyme